MVKSRAEGSPDGAVRRRILEAAFAAFMESGYAQTSTLEIATRARVSKRALYDLVGNKQAMLVACISERAKRLQESADLPEPRDRAELEDALTAFGTQLLREVSDPAVIAVFRLAIAEAVRAPEVARALDSIARDTSRTTFGAIITRAQSAGIIIGSTKDMADQFAGLLWRNTMLDLLLRVADRPAPKEIAQRARDAAAAFLQLFCSPEA
jgi:AcrR family transcriptional regulator